MKSLSKSNKLITFIATKITDIITIIDNKGKYAVYTGGNINGIYCYIEMIGAPTKFTTSGQRSHNFGPSSYIKNNTQYLQSVISALRIIQKSICECCGIIGHKADD